MDKAKCIVHNFMKRILYITVGLLMASVMLSLSSCKGPKLKEADEAYDRGEYYDAATIYRKLYNRYNRKEDAWLRGELAFQLGMCHLKLNQGNRATAAFQNAIRYEYEDTTVMLRLAQAQQREGQYAAAIKSYNEYLAIAPGAFIRVGTGGGIDAHHPRFTADPKALFPTARFFAALAEAELHHLKGKC